ncbi:MAG: hypothetical protein ACTSU5_13880 [Promethearchaeota archaeon]
MVLCALVGLVTRAQEEDPRDLADLMGEVGQLGDISPTTFRMVEVDSAGEFIREIPFQLEPVPRLVARLDRGRDRRVPS